MKKIGGPNPTLDAAVKTQLERIKTENLPPDMAAKIIGVAVAWERAKHAIIEGTDSGGFNPDAPDEEGT